LGLWESKPLFWKVLSAISAVIAVALPIINLQKIIKKINEVSGNGYMFWQIMKTYGLSVIIVRPMYY
jgi:hypothetical protein